ncbi:hypothetical protein B9S64_32445 [Streptomyces sp. SM18]|nr:hypothetical protein B9S64_32445 [Streptomyces sp. SM18]
MPDPESLERITARRAEVDELAVAEHGRRTGLHDAFASLADGLIRFRRLKQAARDPLTNLWVATRGSPPRVVTGEGPPAVTGGPSPFCACRYSESASCSRER